MKSLFDAITSLSAGFSLVIIVKAPASVNGLLRRLSIHRTSSTFPAKTMWSRISFHELEPLRRSLLQPFHLLTIAPQASLPCSPSGAATRASSASSQLPRMVRCRRFRSLLGTLVLLAGKNRGVRSRQIRPNFQPPTSPTPQAFLPALTRYLSSALRQLNGSSSFWRIDVQRLNRTPTRSPSQRRTNMVILRA